MNILQSVKTLLLPITVGFVLLSPVAIILGIYLVGKGYGIWGAVLIAVGVVAQVSAWIWHALASNDVSKGQP